MKSSVPSLVAILRIAALLVQPGQAQVSPQPAPVSPDSAKSLEDLAPLATPASVTNAPPEIRPNAQRKLVRFGPYNLPASKETEAGGAHGHDSMPGMGGGLMSGGPSVSDLDLPSILGGNVPLALAKFLAKSQDPEGFNIMHQVKEGICNDCTVLSSKMDAIFENGTRADISSGVYLHHIITIDIAERDMANDLFNTWLPFCSGADWIQPIANAFSAVTKFLGQKKSTAVFGFGAVDEFKQMFSPPAGNENLTSGFYLGKSDTLMMQAEIVNYRKEPQQVYLQADIEYMPGKVGKEATTTFASVTACKDPIVFRGNGDAGTYESEGVTAQQDGTIISARGHMHDGGDSMEVLLNDKSICTSTATYGQSYNGDTGAGKNWTTISKMGACNDVIPVKKGDKVKLRAAYDEKAHPLRESDGMPQMQMGLVAFTFVPENKVA